MPRTHVRALAALALLLLAAPGAGAQARRIELSDVARIVRVSDPQISPDGRTALVLVSRADLGANEWRAELVLVDVAAGGQTVVARGLRALGHARWSPGGDRIAYLARAG